MSTTPPTFASKISADYSWLTHHIILLLLVVGLAGGLFYEVNNVIEKHDIERQNADQKVLALVTQQTEDLKTQLAKDEAASAAQDAARSAEIKSLTALISQQNQELVKQKQIDATLTAQQTALALTQKTSAQPGEIVAQANNVTMDLSISRTVNSDLDELVTDRKQIPELQTQFQDQLTITQDSQRQLNLAQRLIGTQTTQLADADKVCNDKIAIVKAKARKRGFWATLGGIVGGIILAHTLGI